MMIEIQANKVPKLRFRGFSDRWEEKRLGSIATLSSSKRVYLSDYVRSGIPFYRGKEISELKMNVVPSDILYISQQSYNQFKSKFGAPKKNEILITAVGTLGNVLRVKNENPFYFKDGNLIWLRDIKVNPYYLEILLENSKRRIVRSAIGSSQKALTIVELNKLTLNYPGVEEQKKIAGFLGVVDDKISALQQKKELLQKYKKGIMQKIFSQEIRFKDENGKDYPAWQEKKLGELVRFSRGSELSKANLTYDGKFECIHYGELFTEYHEVINKIKSKTDVDTGVDSEVGDILMPTSDVTPQGLARASSIQKNDVKLGGDINILRPNKGVSSIFLSYLLNFQKKKIMRIVSGTTVRHVYSKDLGKVAYNTPDNLEEQRKIAEFLTSIDEKIEAEERKLEQAKKFKKALLQQMFV